jgi:hypothetical protein
MLPRILEYEDGVVKITAQAYSLPELKNIIDKYKSSEPYLMFVYAMTHPESPYINIPIDEKEDSIIYDIKQTLGDFDFTDELLHKAISKLKSLYTSPIIALAEELGEEIHRFRKYLRDTPLRDGKEGNIGERQSILKDIEKYANNYTNVRQQADKELKINTKGDHEVGGY